MNDSEDERWRGLPQKTTEVSYKSRDEDAEKMVGDEWIQHSNHFSNSALPHFYCQVEKIKRAKKHCSLA